MHRDMYTGEIAPVGPTSFEFVVPEGAPLTISPSVGTVEPGKVPLLYSLSILRVIYPYDWLPVIYIYVICLWCIEKTSRGAIHAIAGGW